MSGKIPLEPNEEKREANQKAQGRQRGPRTPLGIARSCMNATKYGEYVQRIISSQEHKKAREIRKALYEQLPGPRNSLVQGLVEEAVLNRLKKRRCEDRFTHDQKMEVHTACLKNWEQANLVREEPLRRALDFHNFTNFEQLDRMPPETCVNEIRALKGRVEARGLVPAEDVRTINVVYGGDQSVTVTTLVALYDLVKTLLAESKGEAVDLSLAKLAEVKNQIIALLDEEISIQEDLSKQVAAFEIQTLETPLVALPPDSVWDRYFKIVAALDRQFDQILDRARRLHKSDIPRGS